MFKLQLRRYFKSKFTYVIILFMLIITGISYVSLHGYPASLAIELNNKVPDINIEAAKDVIESFASGIYYFESTVMYINDFHTMIWYVLCSLFGVFFCGRLVKDIQTNYLSYVVSRMEFRSYLKETLLAQATYMVSLVGGFFISVLLLSVVIGGGGFTPPILSEWLGYGNVLYVLILLSPIVVLTVFLIGTLFSFELLGLWIKNRYVLQFLPFIYVVGVPVVAFTIGAINQSLGLLLGIMTFDSAIDYYLLSLRGYPKGMYVMVFPVVAVFLVGILYHLNVKKYEKELLA